MKTRGFTLIELVVVITITGILAAVLTVFLRPAIDSYLDTKRRANLTDVADTALRRMGQDIRSAVPNSLRVNGNCFQLVPTFAGGRYRMSNDTTQSSAALDTSQPISANMSFDVLNSLNTLPVRNDWLVINNQNTDDVYNGVNRTTVLSIQTPPPSPGLAVGQHRVAFTPKVFAPGYDGGRFVLVSKDTPTIVYNCDTTAQTLSRGIANFSASLTAAQCAAATQIVANHVSSCTFVYNPNQGATQQSGFMQMQLGLSDNGETVSLVHGVHVENVP